MVKIDVPFLSSQEEEPISLEKAFELGSEMEFLRYAANEGIEVGDEGGDGILGPLNRVGTLVSSTTLNSTQITNQLSDLRLKIEQEYEEEDTLSTEDYQDLEQKVISWQNLLDQELQREKRIPVSETGVLDIEKLLESPQDLFSPLVWKWLDEGPQEDIQEACKSIVIGSSTASVMLSLRAVEHCLRKWHEEETGESLKMGWGHVLDQLMNKHLEEGSTGKPLMEQLSNLPPVLSNLYYLKEQRNEVNHPEKSPDVQEASRTLMVVVGTIRDIYEEQIDEWVIEYEDNKITVSPDIVDEEELIYRAIQKWEQEFKGEIPEEAVIKAGYEMGIPRNKVDETLTSLKMAGEIYEPTDDYLRSVDTV